MPDGFTYLLAYTWSKSIDTGASGYFNESVSITNPYDPNASKSVSGFDVPHVFSFAGVYELPFGQGKRWLNTGLASRIFGNWQFNGIVTLRERPTVYTDHWILTLPTSARSISGRGPGRTWLEIRS